MKIRKALVLSIAAFALVLSACAPAASGDAMTEKATDAMMTEPAMTEAMTEDAMHDAMTEPAMTEAMTEDAMHDAMTETMTEGAMNDASTPEAMMEAPAWFSATLTDVNTGNTFTINDFHGKVVLLEDMAQWCSTCRQQQNEVKTLHAQMTPTPDLVTVVLDIDPNENAETLKTYTAKLGFDWIYAVPSKDVAREIGNLYGAQFLNPPSAPMMIIDRKGEVHPLPFGVKSADSLMKALEPFLNESM